MYIYYFFQIVDLKGMHKGQSHGHFSGQLNQTPVQPVNRHDCNTQLTSQLSRSSRMPAPQRVATQWGIASQITPGSNPVSYSSVNNVSQVSTSSNSLLHYHSSPNITPITQTSHTHSQDMSASSFAEDIQEGIKEEDDLQDPGQMHERLLQHYCDSIETIKVNFRERLQELFFIQSGGNMVDYPAWKQRPNPHLLSFLNVYRLDDNTSMSTPTATNTISPSIKMQAAYSSAGSVHTHTTQTALQGVEQPSRLSNSSNKSRSLNVSVQQYGFVQGLHGISQEERNKNFNNKIVSHGFQKNVTSDQSDLRQVITSTQQFQRSSPSTVHEDIAGQARHESEMLQRISHLRKNGLWSASRLPKVYEQPRKKSHWDFLLEEMQWLATDFSQEKRWKRNMAKKVVFFKWFEVF